LRNLLRQRVPHLPLNRPLPWLLPSPPPPRPLLPNRPLPRLLPSRRPPARPVSLLLKLSQRPRLSPLPWQPLLAPPLWKLPRLRRLSQPLRQLPQHRQLKPRCRPLPVARGQPGCRWPPAAPRWRQRPARRERGWRE
jgi:hypothetical protein